MSRVLAFLSLLLLSACGSSAGVPLVVTSVDDVEVTCRSETRLPAADACRDWGKDLLEGVPSATRVVITLHPRGGPCEADFFEGKHVVASLADIPCRTPEP